MGQTAGLYETGFELGSLASVGTRDRSWSRQGVGS